MFQLTRRERLLVACGLLAILTGMAVKHYRELATSPEAATEIAKNADR